MACLGAIQYDPGTAVAKAATSLLAMTAFDTTNARITFTVPSNGAVMVRIRANLHGSTSAARILLGVLESSTVRMRMSPQGHFMQAILATTMVSQEAVAVVTGLTPGASLTWDAAYGVEIIQTGANVRYGGPNDTTADNAWGALVFEVWECTNLIKGTLYDPSTAATQSMTALLAMTAMDTTNLRLTFNAPDSGRVLWRIHTGSHGSATAGQALLGVLEGAAVVGRVAPVMTVGAGAVATGVIKMTASGVITGLTPGSQHTYDAAYGVETVAGAGGIKYGGPNDTTTDNAFGAIAFEIWAA